MDKTQIITIIITAVITAVIKEIISAILRRIPSVTQKFKTSLTLTIKRIIRKYWRVLFDILGMMFVIAMLRYWVRQFPTVSHGSVFIIAYLAAWLVYWNVELIRDIRKIQQPTT